jgi:glycosyltransferase involved in cell wall biosynthesis
MSAKDKKKTDLSGNILLVANYESDVGYAWWLMENFWVQIARHFLLQGRKCFLMYPRINTIPAHISEAPLLLIEHDFSNRSGNSLAGLKKVIIDNGIRSMYLTDKNPYDIYYLLFRNWGIRKIVLHDHTPGERTPARLHKKIVKKLIHSIGLFSCDHYIGVSKFVYDRFIRCACIPPEKCSYVLNGITPVEIDERFRYYAHEQFNLPKDALIIVTTGRATFYKGIDFLIECANVIINEKKEDRIFFLHCGDGPDLDTFKKQVAGYNLTGKFIFTGKRNDIHKILQSCHIGIQASIGEAFSLSILEYMSAGLATVVPDHCGNKEAITNVENGMLYKHRDKKSVVELLLNLIHNPDYRKRLGASAIKTIQNKFTIDRTNAEFIKMISAKL